ncbi:hypothetical protein D3C73_1038610 [compost metagenome]
MRPFAVPGDRIQLPIQFKQQSELGDFRQSFTSRIQFLCDIDFSVRRNLILQQQSGSRLSGQQIADFYNA